ncbi:MAG: sulfotransferase [Chromatiaceae bacterium]|nr:sulfotransferase [Chromatiaceae bacterium]
MSTQSHVFIGGLHRSGTSILHRCLCDHPDVSGFRDTGAPEDEGQHLQSVFPTARAYGGPGRFGFDPRSHMDESSMAVSAENRAQLLAEWGLHWDLKRKVLVEKSPPNLVRTRFLQALFPQAGFILVMRHPLAVSYATQKWSQTPIDSLLAHWLVCHRRLRKDLPHLERFLLVRYEDLVNRPEETMAGLYRFVGVGDRPLRRDVRSDVNAGYFSRWRLESLAGGLRGKLRFYALVLKYELPIRRFGYSLLWPDAALPSKPG